MEFSSDGCSCLSFNKRVLWGCRLPPAKTRAAVPSEVWGRELSGRAADSARWLRLKLLKWKVHCSNPLVTGSNPVGGATLRKPAFVLGDLALGFGVTVAGKRGSVSCCRSYIGRT